MADDKPKRKVQAGKLRPVLVEDTDPPVILYVKMKWKRFREFARGLSGKSEMDVIDPAHEFLSEVLSDWKNVAGEDGQPLPCSSEGLDELEPSDVMTFFEAVMNLGEAGSGDPLAATAIAATSGEPPAS